MRYIQDTFYIYIARFHSLLNSSTKFIHDQCNEHFYYIDTIIDSKEMIVNTSTAYIPDFQLQ